MGELLARMGGDDKCERKNQLKEIGIGGRILLKQILKEETVLRIRSSGDHL